MSVSTDTAVFYPEFFVNRYAVVIYVALTKRMAYQN